MRQRDGDDRVPRAACSLPQRCCAVVLLVCVTSTGCASFRNIAFRKGNGAIGAGTPCSLSKTPTVAEIVDHLNTNTDKIQGWRASSVRIRAQSVPIPLNGSMVVERDHRLRLEVTSVAGKEVDLGSNDEQIWLWMRPRGQQPPAIYHAAHADMDVARQQMPMPFEPAWLMEALCIAPISADNVEMEGEPGVASIKLVSHHDLPGGQRIKKVITVHACHGYVMEHTCYNAQEQAIVRVLLQDYRLDTESGAVMPHHIKLDWPQAEMSLAMDMGHIEVNPTQISPMVWALPQIPGTPMVNLGDPRLTGLQYASRARTAPAEEQSAKPPVVASSQEELNPAFLPSLSSKNTVAQGSARSSIPPEDLDVDPSRIRWEEPEFLPPEIDDVGRASVPSMAVEPF